MYSRIFVIELGLEYTTSAEVIIGHEDGVEVFTLKTSYIGGEWIMSEAKTMGIENKVRGEAEEFMKHHPTEV